MRLTECSVINSIAYRGDRRPPEEIFSNGFWNRQTPEAQWLQVLDGGSDDVDPEIKIKSIAMDHLTREQQLQFEDKSIPKDCEPLVSGKLTYRLWLKSDPSIYITFTLKRTTGIRFELWKHYAQNLPLYRETDRETGKAVDDISPKTAVCFTLRPHVAPYFPIEGCETAGGEWIWIYAVVLGAAYKTYAIQTARGSELRKAKEVAVEHVSPQHILCAVRFWRKGKYPTMEFLLSHRIIWNPVAGGERMLCKNDILAAFDPYQGIKATCTGCEVLLRVKAPGLLFSEPPYPYWAWKR